MTAVDGGVAAGVAVLRGCGCGISLEFIRLMELHAEQVHARVLMEEKKIRKNKVVHSGDAKGGGKRVGGKIDGLIVCVIPPKNKIYVLSLGIVPPQLHLPLHLFSICHLPAQLEITITFPRGPQRYLDF